MECHEGLGLSMECDLCNTLFLAQYVSQAHGAVQQTQLVAQLSDRIGVCISAAELSSIHHYITVLCVLLLLIFEDARLLFAAFHVS